jgi:hypothetical protein
LRRGRSDLQARDPSEHRPAITFRGLGFAPLARPIRRRGEGVQADHRERNQVSRAPARRWKGMLRFLLRNDDGELFGVYARNAQTALSAALRAEAHYRQSVSRRRLLRDGGGRVAGARLASRPQVFDRIRVFPNLRDAPRCGTRKTPPTSTPQAGDRSAIRSSCRPPPHPLKSRRGGHGNPYFFTTAIALVGFRVPWTEHASCSRSRQTP